MSGSSLSTLDRLYEQGWRLLEGIPGARLDAKILLLVAAGLSKERFLSQPRSPVGASARRRYLRLISRRRSGVPLSYLTGVREFWSLPLRVRPGVLIPRPETETVVEQVLGLPGSKRRLADIGTGCGSIALAVARELPDSSIAATDISPRALRTAAVNVHRLGLRNVRLLRGDLLSPLEKMGWSGTCDVIASNPPYVSEEEWEGLSPQIRNHEPRRALVAGRSGLEVILRLVAGALKFLRPGGHLVIEIGYGQKENVLSMFGAGWDGVECGLDLSGVPRVVSARSATR